MVVSDGLQVAGDTDQVQLTGELRSWRIVSCWSSQSDDRRLSNNRQRRHYDVRFSQPDTNKKKHSSAPTDFPQPSRPMSYAPLRLRDDTTTRQILSRGRAQCACSCLHALSSSIRPFAFASHLSRRCLAIRRRYKLHQYRITSRVEYILLRIGCHPVLLAPALIAFLPSENE